MQCSPSAGASSLVEPFAHPCARSTSASQTRVTDACNSRVRPARLTGSRAPRPRLRCDFLSQFYSLDLRKPTRRTPGDFCLLVRQREPAGRRPPFHNSNPSSKSAAAAALLRRPGCSHRLRYAVLSLAEVQPVPFRFRTFFVYGLTCCDLTHLTRHECSHHIDHEPN